MRSITAISVDNDLAARQPGIALRTAGDKAAGRIDVVFRILIDEIRRHGVSDNVLQNLGTKLFVRYFGCVL